MRAIAIIPARCGSKGFENKNIAKIDGKTLIEWAVEVAKKSKYIEDIYISTDCKKYEEIGIKAGAKSLGLRDKHLATDKAKSVDVVLDLISRLNKNYDYIVLLQPTSPIRMPQDIDNMIEQIKDFDAMVSIAKVDEPHPYKMKIIKDGKVKSFLKDSSSEVPRQMLPNVYKLTGAIYVVKYDSFLKYKTFLPINTKPYISDSWDINIDSIDDYLLLKAKLEYYNKNMKELLNV